LNFSNGRLHLQDVGKYSTQEDCLLTSRLTNSLASLQFKRLTSLRAKCYSRLSSTQKLLLQRSDVSEGDIVWSLVQTEGYGREGRIWVSQRGGLWFSIVLEPDQLDVLDKLVVMASNAIKKTFQIGYGLANLEIKLPNDVICNGKKIAGILADVEIEGRKTKAVLGLGINLNNDPSTTEGISKIATSYFLETRKNIDLVEFLTKLLKNLDNEYSVLLST
jgi:BirA family biotin operon repressor/biotin-[acetyl-CoA-carboxylase] ligase